MLVRGDVVDALVKPRVRGERAAICPSAQRYRVLGAAGLGYLSAAALSILVDTAIQLWPTVPGVEVRIADRAAGAGWRRLGDDQIGVPHVMRSTCRRLR